LILLKYVSDSFDSRRQELNSQFKNPAHEYYLDPIDFGGADSAEYQAEINAKLEQRDYYAETNVFWVPKVARWAFLQNQNKVVINSVIWLSKAGEVLTQSPQDDAEKRLCTRISSVGQLIDHALEAIEQDNAKLKGILNKRYTSQQIDPAKLGELIDLIATIPFKHDSLSSKDILGHVYEYFLGQFALAEGKKGGQFYTPKSIVSLIVQMLERFKGRVYDPAMGSGATGMIVS
jgi:type I restriction enzyme M protein